MRYFSPVCMSHAVQVSPVAWTVDVESKSRLFLHKVWLRSGIIASFLASILDRVELCWQDLACRGIHAKHHALKSITTFEYELKSSIELNRIEIRIHRNQNRICELMLRQCKKLAMEGKFAPDVTYIGWIT